MDLVTVTNFWRTVDNDMPIGLWRRLLPSSVTLAAGLGLFAAHELMTGNRDPLLATLSAGLIPSGWAPPLRRRQDHARADTSLNTCDADICDVITDGITRRDHRPAAPRARQTRSRGRAAPGRARAGPTRVRADRG